MKVILLADVKKVGKKGDVKEVSDGYARNFLIAKGLAVQASADSMKVLAKQNENEAERQASLKAEAEALKTKLEGMTFEFKVNAKNGIVFNSISTKHLQEALRKKDIIIDKRKMIDKEPITQLGYSNVKIELYKGSAGQVIGTIKVLLKE